MTLDAWLTELFPQDFSDESFDIAKILKGFDEHMRREMADGRIPQKWTDTELQWDPICNALFDHYSQTNTERLAWMLVKMVADRSHGQWRITGNGGRVPALETLSNRNNWLFAIRARLGVVDGWIRQNNGVPYSKHLFEACSNPLLMLLSPKTTSWNGVTDRSMLYARIVEILDMPISVQWLLDLETFLKVDLLSDEGLGVIQNIEMRWSGLSRKEQKVWGETNPLAVGSLVQHIQHYAFQAFQINRCFQG